MLQVVDPKPIRDTILETFEECLDAQLRAVRGLRRVRLRPKTEGW
jgi:hypothetical protein